MEQLIPVLQVVGFQNSGKTTLVSKLVQQLHTVGLRVGTIKHHGHGGMLQLGDSGKDTESHRLAGASVVSVEGGGSLQLTAQNAMWNLQNMLELYRNFELDVILIEGYKQDNYPKVVLIKDTHDVEMITSLANIVCVISLDPIHTDGTVNIPYFLRTEEEKYMTYLLEHIRGNNT